MKSDNAQTISSFRNFPHSNGRENDSKVIFIYGLKDHNNDDRRLSLCSRRLKASNTFAL